MKEEILQISSARRGQFEPFLDWNEFPIHFATEIVSGNWEHDSKEVVETVLVWNAKQRLSLVDP